MSDPYDQRGSTPEPATTSAFSHLSRNPQRSSWTTVGSFQDLPQQLSETGLARPSFFHNILNRTDNSEQNWHFDPQLSPSPVSEVSSEELSWLERPITNSAADGTAAASVERNHFMRDSSMPFGHVDLTNTPNNMPPRTRSHRPLAGSDPQSPAASSFAGPSSKRKRKNDGSSQETASASETKEIEQIDPTAPVPLLNALRKQQQDAIAAQEDSSDQPLRMSRLTCIICLDTPTNLTATSCGHWFCHTCLMEALIAGENRAAPGEARRSQCPVCRKNISRKKATEVFSVLAMQSKGPPQPTKKKI